MEFNFNNKRHGRKTGGKNPNAERKSNGPKALSNGEFMIAFGDENSAVASDSRNDVNNEPVNMESTKSQTIVIESSAREAASSESINTSSEELTVLEEFATVHELLVEQEQNPEETATDSNVFDVGDDDEAEEADIPIPEEDEQAGEDKDSVLEEYFHKIQDRIQVEMYHNADQFPQEYQNGTF
ncbi:hypothetical protein INT45_002919 [Circinella minor]|uniref:Uncharacterized protein n=1 Tax=Circinella minor TaxID=1195481 RepID=A0A8H7VCD1_9FUNG|nr:hypothetical protein INT45_002919 [Circinella minor]